MDDIDCAWIIGRYAPLLATAICVARNQSKNFGQPPTDVTGKGACDPQSLSNHSAKNWIYVDEIGTKYGKNYYCNGWVWSTIGTLVQKSLPIKQQSNCSPSLLLAIVPKSVSCDKLSTGKFLKPPPLRKCCHYSVPKRFQLFFALAATWGQSVDQ